MGDVFINYRVAEENMGAAVIHETLSRNFGAEHVFRDCNSMQAGEHYPEALRAGLARADILLVVIGPRWIQLRDPDRIRLIDRERDWVRWEIEQALHRKIIVIPVLLKVGTSHPLMPAGGDLPPSIRDLALRQAYVLDQARLGTGLDALATHLVSLVPELVVPRLFTTPAPPRPADSAPSTLLRPEYAVVPFTGQADHLAGLRAWATDSAVCSARMVVGPGGSGKTRLARMLCDELARDGWLTGIVHGKAPAADIRHTAGIDKPLLVVVDDVETRTDQLAALGAAVGERRTTRDAPARLLLLGRSAGDWLYTLHKHADKRVRELFLPIHRGSTTTLTATGLDAQFAAAKTAFAAELGRPEPTAELPAGVDGLLMAHATALAVVLGGADRSTVFSFSEMPAVAQPIDLVLDNAEKTPQSGRPVAPLHRLLRLDRSHFRRLARAHDAAHLDPALLAAVGTVATLCRAASPEQSDSLLARLPAMIGPVDDYVSWLGRMYPGPYPLAPIRPDVLGEELVAATLADRPGLAVAVATHGTDHQVTNALTVLGRALREHPALCDVVRAMLKVNPNRLVPIGVVVAAGLSDPEPFSRVVGGVISDSRIGVGQIWTLMDQLGRAGGRSADPVRVSTLDAFVGAFTNVMNQNRPDVNVPPELVRLADGVTGFVMNMAKALLDPGSGTMPQRPEGGDIVPRDIMELLRTLMEGQPSEDRP